MKIAITPHSFARYSKKPLDMLNEAGVSFTLNELGRRCTEDESIAMLKGCSGLISGNGQVTRRVIESCPALKIISQCGATADNVDTAYAEQKGIAVTIAPNGQALAVAEMTVGLMIALSRQTVRMDRELRGGVWKKRMGALLQGKKVGIIGFGTTGHTVMRLLEPFGVQIAYQDPFVNDPVLPKLSLDELLGWADIVTLHCPRVGGYLLDAAKLARIRRGGLVLNLAKCGLVDEKALNGLLCAEHLAGAALDVFEKEPYEGPLKERENVILTPHVGAATRESRVIMECEAVKNVLAVLAAPAAV